MSQLFRPTPLPYSQQTDPGTAGSQDPLTSHYQSWTARTWVPLVTLDPKSHLPENFVAEEFPQNLISLLLLL